MSELSEEEILKILKQVIKPVDIEHMSFYEIYKDYVPLPKLNEAIQGLLNLYQKEKQTSHFLQSELDQANAKLIEEKERNKKLEEGLKYRIKYCGILERDLYGNENIELTKIEQELLEERN